MSSKKERFIQELRLIPWWACGLAILIFAGVQAFFWKAAAHGPVWATIIPVVAGILMGLAVLLVGYVNRDAKRRGMSATLWTLLVIFIPNAIGFVIYFLVRKPRRIPCPGCGCQLESDFHFCPQCKYEITPRCPECSASVASQYDYCPQCGADVRAPAREPSAGPLEPQGLT
jgi:hypothetical protein